MHHLAVAHKMKETIQPDVPRKELVPDMVSVSPSFDPVLGRFPDATQYPTGVSNTARTRAPFSIREAGKALRSGFISAFEALRVLRDRVAAFRQKSIGCIARAVVLKLYNMVSLAACHLSDVESF